MALLEVKQLTMRFGGLTAVNQVDFKIEPGQILSVIGPNGAGKTTVFNAITGIYEPTAGQVLFLGAPLCRPFRWQVGAACGFIALLTALAGAIIASDVNLLWRAAIKRPYEDKSRPFTAAAAWQGAVDYLAGRPMLEPLRRGRWAVVSGGSSNRLAEADNRDEAAVLQSGLASLMARLGAASNPSLIERDGNEGFVVRGNEAGPVLRQAANQAVLVDWLDRLREVEHEGRTRRWWVWGGLVGGGLIGAAGSWVTWQRSRRTPDVISRGGVARTFQNIRLFQNMTALDNVLIGMDRRFRHGVLRMMVRTPALRRAERTGRSQAEELLAFVGLEKKRLELARNLPYGDQRRLEIARALATEPRLLLLDEPAAGMNPSESHDLMGLIRRIRDRGVTVLLIEHHMKLVMDVSDRIVVLDYGSKIAEGTPAEVRANPKVIEAYLGKDEVS